MSDDHVSHDEALRILSRFNASHFNNPTEHARYSIPVRPSDDDVALARYIEQSRATEAQLAAVRAVLRDGTLTRYRLEQALLTQPTPAQPAAPEPMTLTIAAAYGAGQSATEAQLAELQQARAVEQRKLQSATATLAAAITDAQSCSRQLLTLIDGTPEQRELQELRERRRAGKRKAGK